MSYYRKRKTITVHDKSVVIGSIYSNRPLVADIVAKEINDGGHQVIYLDSLVHGKDDKYEGYSVSGCVSTILTSEKPIEDSVLKVPLPSENVHIN